MDAHKRQVVGVVVNHPLETLLHGQVMDKRLPVSFAEFGHGGVLLAGGRESTWNIPSRSRHEYKDFAEAVP